MYGFIEKDSDLKIEDAVYDKVLNAGLGWMHELKKGQTFRILDIEGNQAVDTTFYDLENPEDHYGAVQTIVAQKNIYLTTGLVVSQVQLFHLHENTFLKKVLQKR